MERSPLLTARLFRGLLAGRRRRTRIPARAQPPINRQWEDEVDDVKDRWELAVKVDPEGTEADYMALLALVLYDPSVDDDEAEADATDEGAS